MKRRYCRDLSFHPEMPKVNNLKTEDFAPEQLTARLEAIGQDPSIQGGDLMKMARFTDMRRGERFRLQWQDVDFDRGFIHLRDPKGGTDEKIPLNAAARDLLTNHLRTGSPQVFPGRSMACAMPTPPGRPEVGGLTSSACRSS